MEEKLISEIRAITISCKGGISLNNLRRDFLDLGGSPDMYKNLGFNSIEEFVLSRPREFPMRNGLVSAALREESSHIQKLVNQQSGGKGGRTSRITPPAQTRGPKGRSSNSRSSNYGPRPKYGSRPSYWSRPRAEAPPYASSYGNQPSASRAYPRPPLTAPQASARPLLPLSTQQNDIPPRVRPSTHVKTVQNGEQTKPRLSGQSSACGDQRTVTEDFRGALILLRKAWPSESFINESKSHRAKSHDIHDVPPKPQCSSQPQTNGGTNIPTSVNGTEVAEKLLVRRAWPSELFTNESKSHRGKGHDLHDAPPKPQCSSQLQTNGDTNIHTSFNGTENRESLGDVPFSKFKAKEPASRKPYRHTSSYEQDDEDDGDDDFEEMFKVVPPLHDPVQPPDSAITKPPAAKTQPPVTTSKSSAPSNTEHSSLTVAASVSSLPPPSATNLQSKTPAASRLARLQALTQPTQVELQRVASAPASNISNSRRGIDASPRDIQDRLLQLCSILHIPQPEYKILSDVRGEKTVYTCYIKVGNEMIVSAPVTDSFTARSLAISKAYITLNAKLSASTTPAAPSEEDTTLFLSRIRQILQQKPSGMWLDSLADAYQDTFHLAAPARWQEAVTSCPNFTTSTALGRLLLHVNTTGPPPGFDLKFDPVVPPPGFTAGATAQTALLAEAAAVPLPLSPEIPSENNGKSSNPRRLPPLDVPNTLYWDFYVLVVNTPQEIVGRIIGPDWSDKHDEMVASLELEMMSGGKPVVAPVEGEIYAVQISGFWLRARLERVLPGAKAEISFIDDGGDEIIDMNQIFHLDDQFFNLAPQALRLSLNGLEAFPDVPHLHKVLVDKLLRRIYIAEVIKVYSVGPEDSYLACAILWDTNTPEDVNVNSLLMEQVVVALQAPSLSLGTTREMVVSHVGDGIYLQAADQSVQCIACLVEYCVDCAPLVDSAVSKIVVNKTSVVKNPKTDTYQRATVLEVKGDKLVVRLIDYGTTVEVGINQIYDAENICRALAIAPALAVKVTLAGIVQLTGQKLTAARTAMSPGELVVAKVVDIDSGVPTVELYRRNPIDHALQSINNMLKAIGTGSEEEEPPSEPLPPPMLPTKGDLLFVNVTIAASPSVFTVQLVNHYDDISQLMNDLQAAALLCAAAPDVTKLTPGHYYAVIHASNWYRAKLNAVIGDDAVSVELCDFGNLVLLSVESVRELPLSFRTLPGQALRATLAGVTPVNGDWSPSECVFFQELVLEKELAAILAGIRQCGDGPVLELRLIDTSDPDKDVDIVNVLVERGVAARVM